MLKLTLTDDDIKNLQESTEKDGVDYLKELQDEVDFFNNILPMFKGLSQKTIIHYLDILKIGFTSHAYTQIYDFEPKDIIHTKFIK